MNQAKATEFAAYVDAGTLRKIVKLTSTDAAEAKAALAIQKIRVAHRAKTGEWLDVNVASAQHFGVAK